MNCSTEGRKENYSTYHFYSRENEISKLHGGLDYGQACMCDRGYVIMYLHDKLS